MPVYPSIHLVWLSRKVLRCASSLTKHYGKIKQGIFLGSEFLLFFLHVYKFIVTHVYVYVFCSGYAADNITHCVRPEDTKDRRAVIILRR